MVNFQQRITSWKFARTGERALGVFHFITAFADKTSEGQVSHTSCP